jgi:hypothetical protein
MAKLDVNLDSLLNGTGSGLPPSGSNPNSNFPNVIVGKEGADKVDETETKTDEVVKTDTETDKTKTTDKLDTDKSASDTDANNGGTDNDDTDAEVTVLDQLLPELGVEFTDEEKAQFENSIPGIINAAKVGAKKLAGKQLEAFFEKNPLVYDFAAHLSLGGKPEDYAQQMLHRWETTTLGEDVAQHRSIYIAGLKQRGYSESDINDLVETAETKGVLQSKATDSLAYLKETEKKGIEDRQLKVQQKADKAIKDAAELDTNIKKVITSGKLDGVELTPNKRRLLKNTISSQWIKQVIHYSQLRTNN